MQTDCLAAYDTLGGAGMVHAACWAHSRRKFFDALKLNPDDRTAALIVKHIDALFGIDAEARANYLDYAARHALRSEGSVPLPELIRKQVEAAKVSALPASALGKACLHAEPLGQAHALSGTSGTRTEQQPGGELHAAAGAGQKELDPHRQPAGWAEGGGYSLGG